jgi:hypothetical protein
MEIKWSGLDNNALKALYENKLQELNAALLRGAEWEALRDQRHEVTQLSILLSKRQFGNPAEYNSRIEETG